APPRGRRLRRRRRRRRRDRRARGLGVRRRRRPRRPRGRRPRRRADRRRRRPRPRSRAVSRKVVVCRCEDVTEKDVARAVALGYADIEEVKRYTGFGTGPCQGKECQAMIAGLLAELAAVSAGSVPPFTARPPLQPTPLGILADLGEDDA